MKRFSFEVVAAAIALLAAAACTQEASPADNTPEEVQDGFKVLSIEASQADTKTAYANEITFSWSAGDKISVLCNDGSSDFWQIFEVTTPAASSTFTATVASGVNIGAVDGTKVALYPASESHVYNSSSDIRFHIPAERDFRAASGGHKESAIPMFAWGDDSDTFAFANLTGAVKFSFSKIPSAVTQVKMEFLNTCHLKMNGTYALSLDNDATKVDWSAASTEVNTESSVSYYADVENGTASFYLPYAQGSLWAWNHLTLSDAVTGAELYGNTKVGQINVTRNRIVVLPTLSISTGFTSAYGIDWSSVSAAESSDSSYPAIKSMKAQADENYLYLLLEVDPAQIETSHTYAHRMYLYAGNWSTQFGYESWAVHNGAASYYNWQSGYSDCTPDTSDPDSWLYEIRISRSHSTTSAALGQAGTVEIGVKMDNRICDNNGAGEEWGYSGGASSTATIGKIPSSGLYPVTLPASSTPVNNVNIGLNFTESGETIANPERGLYMMVEYKYHKRTTSEKAKQDELPTSEVTPVTTGLSDSYYQCYQDASHTNTLVLTLFYMHDFVNEDHISQDGIDYVRSVLSNIRSAGKKAIVRFAYNNRHPSKWDMEPTAAQIENHLEDLHQTLLDYEDVIYVVQAGFIGTYGEWYYTTNFGPADGGVDYIVSGNSVSNYANRSAVIRALLDNVPQSRQIELRTPEYKACFISPNALSSYESFTGFGTDDSHRLGFHNDAFLYGNGGQGGYKGDMGTFSADWQKNMWKDQGAYLINGGEAPYSSKPIEGMDGYYKQNVMEAIYGYHYSYLHHDTGYHSAPESTSADDGSTLMRHWHNQGWMGDIEKWLGYRLYLTDATVTGANLSSGTTLEVSLTLANSGSAPVVNVRPMELVLLHGSTATVLSGSTGDIRLVPPGTVSLTSVTPGTHTYTFSVTLPQAIVTGDKLALWLPDNAEGLQSRAEYSIRLANNETTWTSNGYNVFYTFE